MSGNSVAFGTLGNFWGENGSVGFLPSIGALALAAILVRYAITWRRHHWQHAHTMEPQIPPEYPSLIPLLNVFFLVFDARNFLDRITTYQGKLTSTRLSMFGRRMYFFQEREVVAKMWKSTDLSSPVMAITFVLEHVFGMPNKALAVYKADDSGPFPKPHPQSNVLAHNRVGHLVHHNMQRGLAGPSLLPATNRLEDMIRKRVDDMPIGNDWVEMPDYLRFVYDVVGLSIMETFCGPSLLKLNPDFADDFWIYDKHVPLMARGVPSFIIPSAYRARKRLLRQIKNWYHYARKNFSAESVGCDGDGDPFWGTEMMRSRQETLLRVDGQDDDSVAALDLGFIWAAVSNVLNASAWATIHVLGDSSLLNRIRPSVKTHNCKALDHNPLLASTYAETLRLYTKSYMLVHSPYSDVQLGRWWLPKGGLGLVNSHSSHMDASFWNTKDGLHPVNEFWAERFLYYPNDALSGPVNAEFRTVDQTDRQDGLFSLEGLDSAWIPYGGGYKKCPGRFLARSAINLTCATIFARFDVEIPSPPEPSGWKFGMGVLRPKGAIAFKVRRRT